MEHTLNWISRHDPQSLNYPIQAIIPQKTRPTAIWWGSPKEHLDQGREGACVGYAWTNKLLAKPSTVKLPQPSNDFALNLYRSAQKIDEWEGEAYEGTSVLAGAKVLKLGGFVSEYRWAFGVEDVLDALAFVGPVVLGVPWFDSMYSTGPGGLVRVSGSQVGGHAILATGFGVRRFGGLRGRREFVVRWRNSWGFTYGVGGDGYIRLEDLGLLLKGVGEACVPVVR